MARKTRITISTEINNLIISLANDEQKSTSEIARILNVSVTTVRKLVRNNENGIPFAVSSVRRKETCRKRNNFFTPVEQKLYQMVTEQNELIQKEMKEVLLETTREEVSQSTVSRKLKKLGFTRKRLSKLPLERNNAAIINTRAVYAGTIGRIPDEKLIFLDESGFNLHTARSYGYSLVNQKAYKYVPGNRGINKSLMCAIGKNGVIAYKLKNAGYNKVFFINFIETKLKRYFELNPGFYLIMDNVKFHHSPEVKSKLRELRINFDYLPAYSPQLNPIEEFFSMLKARFCSAKIINPDATIEVLIDNILSSENDYTLQCHGFYESMRRWIVKAGQRLPFI